MILIVFDTYTHIVFQRHSNLDQCWIKINATEILYFSSWIVWHNFRAHLSLRPVGSTMLAARPFDLDRVKVGNQNRNTLKIGCQNHFENQNVTKVITNPTSYLYISFDTCDFGFKTGVKWQSIKISVRIL